MKTNVRDFDRLSALDDEGLELLDQCDGRPYQKRWRPIRVAFNNDGAKGDSPNLQGSLPVFNEAALLALGPLIRPSAETLPLDCKAEKLFAINVTAIVDCLDRKRSVMELFPDGGVMRIDKHVFRTSAQSPHHLFKIPETRRSEVFASDTFKTTLEKSGLKGLFFTPVEEA